MRIFVSWSGERSKLVANLLDEWLVCVLQACRPWVSTKDIDKGSLWFSEISDQLRETSVGIICLTQDNKTKPWILFEAGALAKGLTTSRVCTLLIDLEPRDVSDPLAQFNHTLPNNEGIYSLVKTINSALGTAGLDPKVLDKVFETYWPEFDRSFREILKNVPSATGSSKPRDPDDILGEILDHTRSLTTRVRRIESEIRENNSSQHDPINVRPRLKYLSASEARTKAIELLRAGLEDEQILSTMQGDAPTSYLQRIVTEWREANESLQQLGDILGERASQRGER